MRHVVGGRTKARHAAATSRMGSFKTDMLMQPANSDARVESCGRWIDVVRQRRPARESALEPGRLVSGTHGRLEGIAIVPAQVREIASVDCRRLLDLA